MAIHPLTEPATTASARSALWTLGFRPFYLLAASFSAIAILLWLLILSGRLTLPAPTLPGLYWHAHEMIFGFAVAVIIGFLYTAGRNWTGLPTPSGSTLMALAALWLGGRISLLFSGGLMAALIDFAFLPLAAIGLGRVLVRSGNRRNYFMLVILGALALVNLSFHLARLGFIGLAPLGAIHAALGLIVMLETVMGGRVIPMFTENGLRMALGKSILLIQSPLLNRSAISATGVALLLWVLEAGPWAAAASLLAMVLQLVRSFRWRPWLTTQVPMLWILHAAHLWIPIGLGLVAAVQLGWLPPSAAVHAFSIGATGGLIIGMITRTALGHTGRPLQAGKIETTAYTLIMVAVLARVLTLSLQPALAKMGIHFAASCWILAFSLYVFRYAPFLTQPRPDGRPD